MSDNEINSSASALPTNSITSNTGSESVKDLIKEVRAALINYFQVNMMKSEIILPCNIEILRYFRHLVT